ncbi:MAG: ATP synthase F1 subunit epsilon [Thermoanaerobaculia bacterium]|nr:ATP synthase F1 subunit epsilon [Thermoanaerobaculia bacterium]
MADAKLSTPGGKLRFVLVTHDRKLLDETCDEVQLPGRLGAIGILPSHAPMIATLGTGETILKSGGKERSVMTADGLVQVADDVVTVLTDAAWLPEEIDVAAAEKAAREAEQDLGYADPEWKLARTRLEKAQIQVQVGKKAKG